MNGKKLKELREKTGLSQVELGEIVGTSGAFISWLEQELKEPSVVTLKRLAQVFNCTVDDLLK